MEFVVGGHGGSGSQASDRARLSAGFSQEELADQANMHSTAIILDERGLRQPTLHTVFNLLRMLQIEPSVLVAEMEALKPEVAS